MIISADSFKKLCEQLQIEEGYRRHPYRCTAGKLTIGYSRNLDDNGISMPEARSLLENDVRTCQSELILALDVFEKLDDVRKMVLIDMCFNMGLDRLLGFKKMIRALIEKDYKAASHEMLNSKWSTQVGMRAHNLAAQMAQD